MGIINQIFNILLSVMRKAKYLLLVGVIMALIVLESKLSDYVERNIQATLNEISVVEMGIAELRLEINAIVEQADVREFAQSRGMSLTNPTNIITLEARGDGYAVRGQSRSIVEQILRFWE